LPETVGEAQQAYEQGKDGNSEAVVFVGSDGTLHQFEPLGEQEESEILEELL
jgi:hypothetical protein